MNEQSAKPRVLITAPRLLRDLASVDQLLQRQGWSVVTAVPRQAFAEDELIPLLAGVDACICGGDRFTARVFDAAPSLRAVQKWGTGIDAIDRDAAAERGVSVRNVPDAFTVPVADTTLAFILSLVRNTATLDRMMSLGGWEPIESRTLAECAVGIVGLGNIGQAVARRLRAFGCELFGADPVQPPVQFLDDTGLTLLPTDELLQRCDVVTLHCDLNPTSRHLIDGAALGRMREHAYLINTARGPVVDTSALVAALEGGMIAGGAFDVHEVEPLPSEHPLRSMPNVLLSPHLAQSSPRACSAVHRFVIESISEMLRESAKCSSLDGLEAA
jgi:D-3-phosphoglycerate dehydrogenase